MKYPWVAEAIIEWQKGSCRYKGKEIFCNECEFDGEICKKLSEVATIISYKIIEKEER